MTPSDLDVDATAVLTWAIAQHARNSGAATNAAVLLDRWFADAAARWPSAWRASRRSPRTMLWLAARSAALASFDEDARESAVLLTEAPDAREAILQLHAIGNVLCDLGVLPRSTSESLPDPLRPPYRIAA